MRKRTYSILSSFFATKALILALIGSVRCNFIKFSAHVGEENVTIKFGPWYYQTWSIIGSVDGIHIHKSCHTYPESMNIDAYWILCRAAIITAGILGASFLFLNIIWVCFCRGKLKLARWEGIEYHVVAIFQGATLLFLNSSVCQNNELIQDMAQLGIDYPDKCSISTGAICIIFSTVLWLLAAATNCTARAAAKKDREEAEPLIGIGSELIVG